MTESQPQQECSPPRTREAVDCWLRKWGRDAVADGTEPLTRQDVERLIEANGGTAEGLELRQRDMRGAYLVGADLQGANLYAANLQGAYLLGANLLGVDLSWANLQGAYLWSAELQGAYLGYANLQGAYLSRANLQDANLLGIQISRDPNLEGVPWPGEYVLPSEEQGRFDAIQFDAIQSTYRALKTWHQEHGFYDIAGEFHHREMVCQRKGNQRDFTISLQKTRNPWRFLKSLFRAQWSRLAAALGLAFYEQLFGYGERPWRVVRAAVIVVLGLALAYRFFGTFVQPVRLMDALYFSAVSFSALGYGSWAPVPLGWARYMGVAESFLGVFTIALFLVTFTRKMVR